VRVIVRPGDDFYIRHLLIAHSPPQSIRYRSIGVSRIDFARIPNQW
jgi:hypothetical protein